MSSLRDEKFMRECFALARKGAGHVSPNPMVGAVLVRKGRIVARGYHHRFGEAHAEVNCLERYKGLLSGSTLYVNLEPCSYYGKTPPCADYLIRKGVPEVVVAMEDPNPLVAGRGIKLLEEAGVQVRSGVLEDEARRLNKFFVRHIVIGLPYVHVKIAQTLDGKIAGGASRWITSVASRRLVHRWRAEYDAVLVGAGTVRADDPLLNVRHGKGRDPDVIILDGRLSVSPRVQLFAKANERRVFLCTTAAAAGSEARKVRRLEKMGVRLVALQEKGGRLDLREVLMELYHRQVGSILVEGGAEIFTQFVREGLVDELSMFIAPELQGEGMQTFVGDGEGKRLQMKGMTVKKVGRDVLISAIIAG